MVKSKRAGNVGKCRMFVSSLRVSIELLAGESIRLKGNAGERLVIVSATRRERASSEIVSRLQLNPDNVQITVLRPSSTPFRCEMKRRPRLFLDEPTTRLADPFCLILCFCLSFFFLLVLCLTLRITMPLTTSFWKRLSTQWEATYLCEAKNDTTLRPHREFPDVLVFYNLGKGRNEAKPRKMDPWLASKSHVATFSLLATVGQSFTRREAAHITQISYHTRNICIVSETQSTIQSSFYYNKRARCCFCIGSDNRYSPVRDSCKRNVCNAHSTKTPKNYMQRMQYFAVHVIFFYNLPIYYSFACVRRKSEHNSKSITLYYSNVQNNHNCARVYSIGLELESLCVSKVSVWVSSDSGMGHYAALLGGLTSSKHWRERAKRRVERKVQTGDQDSV